jgi:hypothetical protein
MRDDIHKGVPVRRPWQTVVRDCALAPDWREKASQRAEAALIGELRGQIGAQFLRNLDANLHGRGQLEITKPPVDPRALRLIAKTRIERLVVDHTLVALSQGADRREAHEQGFVRAIREFKDSICRAVEAHTFGKDPGSARILTARLRHALDAVGSSLPSTLVSGQLPHQPTRQKPAPSLDFALPVKGANHGKPAK